VVVVDGDVGDGGFCAGLMIRGCGGGKFSWGPCVLAPATVHGDAAYSTQMCSHPEYRDGQLGRKAKGPSPHQTGNPNN